MNLAIQDAVELGLGLRERYRRWAGRTPGRLRDGTAPRDLAHPGVLELDAHAAPRWPEPVGRADEFADQLRRARLQELIENPSLSRWFAHAYAGVDP